MRTLAVDIETYSSVDLKKCGSYAYVASPDFEVLLLGYAFEDDPVEVVDLACGEVLPDEVREALLDPTILKTAYNANFERNGLGAWLGCLMPPQQWRCSSVHSLMLGLPGSLELVAKTLKLDTQKDDAGKRLIKFFTMPCKATAKNRGRTRNLPEHDPEKWAQFKAYCGIDVEVERELRGKLSRHPIPKFEQALWCLDQKINDRGVRVDYRLVKQAMLCDSNYNRRLVLEAQELTGLENPNSVSQLKDWLSDALGRTVETLAKDNIPLLMNETDDPVALRMLAIRQELAKTSVKKYDAMARARGRDDRVRGLLQFYGANRTGRWAGRLVQVHNLPKNSMPDLDLARSLLRKGDEELLELLFDAIPDLLSQLIRTALIPSVDCRFIVADFSAIEARVIAWLAGEEWVLDVFRGDGRIYEAAASMMFKVPIDRIAKGFSEYELRAKGKVAVLACGYQGSIGALVAMGALDMGLDADELPVIVESWRAANRRIVRFWYAVERAALTAVAEKRTVSMQFGLKFIYEPGVLFIQLPSGRRLAYVRPHISRDPKFDKNGLSYEGYEEGRWTRSRTYGGKLVENIVQAVARDCLAESMLRLDRAGFSIPIHVHDEVVLDVPKGDDELERIVEIMSEPLSWAPGLPLSADAFETKYYMKD